MKRFAIYSLLVCQIFALPLFRTDYVYSKKTNAFYKLHIEEEYLSEARHVCESEGGKLMMPSSSLDIAQLHGMMKKYPDIGDYVWVGDDGLRHQLTTDRLFIYYYLQRKEFSGDHEGFRPVCEVVTRRGEIEESPCYNMRPFICKVEAREAHYDEHCKVYATGYQYFPTTGSCYKIPNITYTWNGAYADCEAQGAHLVILNSEIEHTVVKDLLFGTELQTPRHFRNICFSAGYRANEPTDGSIRDFRTIFNQTLSEAGYDQWTERINQNRNENCGSLFRVNGKLFDIDCSSEKHSFVCEKEI